jgi:hypothetical protein
MAWLIDTSVLARLANTADAQYATADRAVMELHRRGEVLHVAPQNLIEFRNLATRPKAVNGLGLSAVDAEAKAAAFEGTFPLLAETPDIYPAWKALVGALGVIGCHVHGMAHLLTFNVAHFVRMAGHGPGVVVVDPATV